MNENQENYIGNDLRFKRNHFDNSFTTQLKKRMHVMTRAQTNLECLPHTVKLSKVVLVTITFK